MTSIDKNIDKKKPELDKAAMEQLRFEGHNNAQIAKIMGYDYEDVAWKMGDHK